MSPRRLRLDASSRPLIIAHRGGDGGPANSVRAVGVAIALGVDVVEFDLRRTGDGRLVAWHDPHLPSGRALATVSLAAARAEVPHLALAVEIAAQCGAAGVGLLIDLKETTDQASAIARLHRELAHDRLWVSTTSAAVVREVTDAMGPARVGLSLGGRHGVMGAAAPLADLAGWGRARAAGARFVALRHHLVALGGLALARHHGLPALVWTVDSPRQMARLLVHPAVAGLITNRPAHALAVRAARGYPG